MSGVNTILVYLALDCKKIVWFIILLVEKIGILFSSFIDLTTILCACGVVGGVRGENQHDVMSLYTHQSCNKMHR